MMVVPPNGISAIQPTWASPPAGLVNEAFLGREPSDGARGRIGALTGPEWTCGPAGAL
jgi:hypothetical protein